MSGSSSCKNSSGGSKSNKSKHTHQSRTAPLNFSIEEISEITKNLEYHAKGSYAKVYTGMYQNHQIAVKHYSQPDIISAQNEKKAFDAFWKSKNVVQLFGSYVTDEEAYFVMEFMPSNLKTLLKASTLDWKQTISILKDLAKAIKDVNGAGYIVGDIKPDNILIDENGTAYLCDFGSARIGGRGIPTINNYYAAPEIASQDGRRSPKSGDIFSFGVILLQMITGVNDFQELNSSKTIVKQVKEYVPNRKDTETPHISIYARFLLDVKKATHVVHTKFLTRPGCDLGDAQKITDLGRKCTDDVNGNQRLSIDDIITTLEGLKI